MVFFSGRNAHYFHYDNVAMHLLTPLTGLVSRPVTVDCTDEQLKTKMGAFAPVVSCGDETANASTQCSRLKSCWACAERRIPELGSEDTLVLRSRPDLLYVDTFSEKQRRRECILTRLRSARGFGPAAFPARLFSYHFGNSYREPEGCQGTCEKCVVIDDQFGLMNGTVAALYFHSKNANIDDPVLRSYTEAGGCPAGIWPEHVVSRAIAAYGVCVNSLDFQFRLARDARADPRVVSEIPICQKTVE